MRQFSFFTTWLLCVSAAAHSFAQDASSSDWERSTLTCEPTCRSGYECRRGECLPICSPSCGEGYLCSAEGACVQAEPPAARAVQPRIRWRERADVCEPTCRTGYTCAHNQCVSLCNPVCPANEMCTANGECVGYELIEDQHDKPVRPAARPDTRDSSADSLVNVHVDVAGALQFGLTPTLEVGEQFSGYLQLRIMNTGLASYYLLGRDPEDKLHVGVGAALGMHWFSATRGNMRGVFGGVALEYDFIETSDERRDFALYRTHVLVPQIDFGYRWAFGELLIGVSGKVGLGIPVKVSARGSGERGCRLPDSCDEDLSIALIPGIAVDIGWFIPR